MSKIEYTPKKEILNIINGALKDAKRDFEDNSYIKIFENIIDYHANFKD